MPESTFSSVPLFPGFGKREAGCEPEADEVAVERKPRSVINWANRFLPYFRAQPAQANSVARSAKPPKIVTHPGPGKTSMAIPSPITVLPMTKTTIFRIWLQNQSAVVSRKLGLMTLNSLAVGGEGGSGSMPSDRRIGSADRQGSSLKVR